MADYTPGPWYADMHGPYWCVFSEVTEEAISVMESEEDAKDKANANLMAAAPDLLNELRNLLDWVDELERNGKHPTYDQPSAARAAIRKATGEK